MKPDTENMFFSLTNVWCGNWLLLSIPTMETVIWLQAVDVHDQLCKNDPPFPSGCIEPSICSSPLLYPVSRKKSFYRGFQRMSLSPEVSQRSRHVLTTWNHNGLAVSLKPTEGFIFFPDSFLQHSISFEEFFREIQDNALGQDLWTDKW